MSQGKSGCEMNYFEDLKTLVENKVINLLIPEIILLELEKEQRLSAEKFKNELGKLKKSISLTETWSEIQDVKSHLNNIIQQKKEEKIKDWENKYSIIRKFLKSDLIEFIPITADILCRGKRRLIAGRMPVTNKQSDQDVLLIESLVSFFEKNTEKNAKLLFCSENYKDFAVECKTETRSRKFMLHPLIQEDLPKSRYFIDLESMLDFSKGYKNLPEPFDKNIEQVKQKYDELGKIIDWDLDSDEYYEAFIELENLIRKKYSEKFKKEIIPTLPEEIKQRRLELSNLAKELLEECRKCNSWDDRSELKLNSWLENVPEDMIPYTSLANLFRITKNLKEYLKIHQEMDAD